MAAVIDYFDILEADVCLRVNRLSGIAAIRGFFSVISRLGDGGFWVVMGLGVIMLNGSAGLPAALQMALTGGAGVLVYKLLKRHLVRERPYIRHAGIRCGTAPLDRYSFPSGHTLHSVSFTLLIAEFEPLLLPVALPFAALVAASRVILGLHYPTDVLMGAALGALLADASLALL
ncbi:MAG: phosphatase PAP2 family protein [Gammaproteobacteria bacterium]|nr:phosphatase PAP2 family protein [Gammaproteobacteria bacterium]MDH5310803.1 phosphatase PAP2 family protein [Gammaproteobacteria bacterium]